MNRKEAFSALNRLKVAPKKYIDRDVAGVILDHLTISYSTSSYWDLMSYFFEDSDMEEEILQYFLPKKPEVLDNLTNEMMIGLGNYGPGFQSADTFNPSQAENIRAFQQYFKNKLRLLQLTDNVDTCVSAFNNEFGDLSDIKFASALFVVLCSPEHRIIPEKFVDNEYQNLVKNLYFVLLELAFKFLSINLSTSEDYSNWEEHALGLYLVFYALQGVSERHLTHKLVKNTFGADNNEIRICLLYPGSPHADRSDQIGGQNITTFQLDMPIVDPTYATRLAKINTGINNLPGNPKTLEGVNYLILEAIHQKINFDQRNI
eukprot:snap_masked-scaffold_100-processed-gene-0.11-mRNA-1 protein AED:1.00 eAED:1.00 QI:0/0/0/0/1/1/2/0/317